MGAKGMSDEAVASQGAERHQGRGVTVRSLLITFVCGLIVVYLLVHDQFTQLLTGLNIHMSPPPASLFWTFLLLLLNPLLGKFRFSRAEIAVIYIGVGVIGTTALQGVIGYLVPAMASPVLLRHQYPREFESVFQRLSPLISIRSDEAGFMFYAGGSRVPWGEWIVPIIVWSVFWTVSFWVLLCLAVLVRKHWTERERLVFPLIVPVSEMVTIAGTQEESPRKIIRNVWFLLGLIPPVIIHGSQLLKLLVPALPAFSEQIEMSALFPTELPWSVFWLFPGFRFYYTPILIGLGYIVSLKVSFSMWFFYILFNRLLLVVRVVLGLHVSNEWIHTTYPAVTNGAFLAMGFVSLWHCRDILGRIVVGGLGLSRSAEDYLDKDEPISYRVAFCSCILGLAFILAFGVVLLNIPAWVLLVSLFFFFTIVISNARLRAEAGWPFQSPGSGAILASVDKVFPVGPTNIGSAYVLRAFFVNAFYGWFGTNVAYFLEGLKLGDGHNIERRSLTWFMVIVFVIGLALGFAFLLPVIYKFGMYNVNQHYLGNSNPRLSDWATSSSGQTSFLTWIPESMGFVLALFFAFMNAKFVWWPFHPLACFMAFNAYMVYVWGPFFIAWAIKAFVVRYAGNRGMQEAKPFFIAMIIGGVGMSGLNTMVSLLLRFFH